MARVVLLRTHPNSVRSSARRSPPKTGSAGQVDSIFYARWARIYAEFVPIFRGIRAVKFFAFLFAFGLRLFLWRKLYSHPLYQYSSRAGTSRSAR